MSTNKTPNYQLHSWTSTDHFRFHEVNENFDLLDARPQGREFRAEPSPVKTAPSDVRAVQRRWRQPAL